MNELLGIIAIGRNEGERLHRCLKPLVGLDHMVVYVDSGSADESVAMACGLGADVVELDMSVAFTAARARNAGFERLMNIAPQTRYVQFVDGDCEIADGWLDVARRELDGHDELGVVCGRRRERYPEASIYNLLCDIEWNTAIGEATECGGDAMIRVEALRQVGGYDASVIAGEEPELCFRLCEKGWRVRRIDAEMTFHDADMHRFSQWWKRAVRSGHATAEGAVMHGRSTERFRVRKVASNLMWVLGPPVLASGCFLAFGKIGLVTLATYLLLFVKVFLGQKGLGRKLDDSALYSGAIVIGKFAETVGMWRYLRGRMARQPSVIIEYKHAEQPQR